MSRKELIFIIIIFIVLLLFFFINNKGEADTDKFFYMTSTGYSNHPNCIADKWRDGKTATNTQIREGVIAINVDLVDGEWVVKSPLELGQEIYIEGIGEFSVEDTGSFTESNFKFDYWNVDIYFEDYEEAKEWGIKKVKVYINE